jgi:DNA-binding transcriptional MerR regulator
MSIKSITNYLEGAMAFDKSIADICSYTGLKEPFVRRVIRECKELLVEYFRRGDNNSIMFDDNGLTVFDRVKQLKQDGASLYEIKVKLSSELEKPSGDKDLVEKPSETLHEGNGLVASKLGVKPFWYNELQKAQNIALESKEDLLNGKQEVINQLKQQVLLITDGRSQEEIRREKDNEILKKNNEQDLRIDRIKLLGEIKALEGRYFVGTKRLALLKKLEEIL